MAFNAEKFVADYAANLTDSVDIVNYGRGNCYEDIASKAYEIGYSDGRTSTSEDISRAGKELIEKDREIEALKRAFADDLVKAQNHISKQHEEIDSLRAEIVELQRQLDAMNKHMAQSIEMREGK